MLRTCPYTQINIKWINWKKTQLDLIKITTGGGGLYIHCSPNFPLTTRKLKDMVGNGQSPKSLPWVILINLLREVNSSQRSQHSSWVPAQPGQNTQARNTSWYHSVDLRWKILSRLSSSLMSIADKHPENCSWIREKTMLQNLPVNHQIFKFSSAPKSFSDGSLYIYGYAENMNCSRPIRRAFHGASLLRWRQILAGLKRE